MKFKMPWTSNVEFENSVVVDGNIRDPQSKDLVVMTNLWEVLVPTVRANGRPFRTRYQRVWDQKVRDIIGDLTICSVAKGQWIVPDRTLFKERMIPVRIACTKEQILQIAQMTLTYYDQPAVIVYRISDDVLIFKRE